MAQVSALQRSPTMCGPAVSASQFSSSTLARPEPEFLRHLQELEGLKKPVVGPKRAVVLGRARGRTVDPEQPKNGNGRIVKGIGPRPRTATCVIQLVSSRLVMRRNHQPNVAFPTEPISSKVCMKYRILCALLFYRNGSGTKFERFGDSLNAIWCQH